MTEMTTILAADTRENRFFDMEYFRLCQTITAMCAGANKLYADSANGQNSYDTLMGVEELKKNYLELHASLGAFRERYMSQTENPNSPFANKLRDLENDVREDREVLRTMDLQPGMSLMNAVYESQKKLELGQPEEEQELPGYDTVHKTDYPSFETLHGLPREDPSAAGPMKRRGRLGRTAFSRGKAARCGRSPPPDLERGVLSQDAPYDLLESAKEGL